MVRFTNVLCPVDLTELSSRPLAYAGALARWYDARLTALHVVPSFDPVQVRAGALGETVQLITPPPREAVARALRRVADAAAATAADITVASESTGRDVADTIVDEALAAGADLIVMGTHGRTGIDRVMLGSVSETVLRKAPCAVLTVPPHVPATSTPAVAFKQIICAMDFSAAAMQALGHALDLARQSNGTVVVLHAIEWVDDAPHAHAHFNVPEYRAHLLETARHEIDSILAGESREWCEIVPLIATGRAYREILRAATARAADLIVMGAQGRGGLGLTLFGSTTQQVVRHAVCPVLTVRGAAS